MKKNIICPSEAQECYALKEWSNHNMICNKYLIHIKNGGSLKSAREGRNFKRMGVKSGVSDYFLAYPVLRDGKWFHGLWVEMKRRNQKTAIISGEQKDWLAKMQDLNYYCTVSYGWEQARDHILEYLNG